MGIYINMEMPEGCYYCPFADGVWQVDKRCVINGKEMPRDRWNMQQNHINCPLIPVPKHGRLIDADAILKDKGMGTQIVGWGKMYHETVIEYAHTIIPAEEGET